MSAELPSVALREARKQLRERREAFLRAVEERRGARVMLETAIVEEQFALNLLRDAVRHRDELVAQALESEVNAAIALGALAEEGGSS